MTLEFELKQKEAEFSLELEKERNEEYKKILEFEQKLFYEEVEFKIKTITQLTEIVSKLQNEHCRKVMELITEYRKQQILGIQELCEYNRENITKIAEEAKEYKKDFPEIYQIKLEQLSDANKNHNRLVEQLTNSLQKDIENIEKWLLDSTQFDVEQFVLKITDGKEGAEAFKRYLASKNIDIKLLKDDTKLLKEKEM